MKQCLTHPFFYQKIGMLLHIVRYLELDWGLLWPQSCTYVIWFYDIYLGENSFFCYGWLIHGCLLLIADSTLDRVLD